MVRFNLVLPSDLTDEHLNAENVELDMLNTFIKKNPFGKIPDSYRLGKGHMSFFIDKPNTVRERKRIVSEAMMKRKGESFCSRHMMYIPEWTPTRQDTIINVITICERLRNPLKKKTLWHYYGKPIEDIEEFIKEHYTKYYVEGLK